MESKPSQTKNSSASIHPDTRLGTVHLTVSNLSRSLAFYERVIGLRVHAHTDGIAHLGAGGADLLTLSEQPGARTHLRGYTGLYHFAILVPSRLELARALRRMLEARTPMDGYSDHKVSEALYLPDPDGNGIEVYCDRPRSEWFDAQGNFRMATDPLDIESVLRELRAHPEPADRMDPATVIGHIHLHVAHIGQAEQFYVGALGFELMARYGPSASFVSAGGYHHHVGFNTWAGVGAPPPPPNSVGLRYFEVRLPNPEALAQTVKRLRAAGVTALEERSNGVLVRDPSQNAMLLTLAP
ncbi:MAG: VOC family protein [Anaerolineales bacterium]|nr:VOC family protein [Anaerolineales bacterium]